MLYCCLLLFSWHNKTMAAMSMLWVHACFHLSLCHRDWAESHLKSIIFYSISSRVISRFEMVLSEQCKSCIVNHCEESVKIQVQMSTLHRVLWLDWKSVFRWSSLGQDLCILTKACKIANKVLHLICRAKPCLQHTLWKKLNLPCNAHWCMIFDKRALFVANYA